MRSNQSKDEMLIAVAKKKPQLQALVDSSITMEEIEIEQLNQPLWIRQALLILKRANGKSQKERLDILIQNTIEQEEKTRNLPIPTYTVYIWDSESQFLGGPSQFGNTWQIELNRNDPIIIMDNYFRVQDSTIPLDQASKFKLELFCKPVGEMTILQYKSFCRALVSQKYIL